METKNSKPRKLPFTHSLTASVATTGFTATGLAEGLTLHPETGVISDAPIRLGEHTVQVAATHALGATAPTCSSRSRATAPKSSIDKI